jgi:phosphoglycerate dehydrogenase-like enzyme
VRILVLSNIYSSDYGDDSPERRAYLKGYPQCEWRFRSGETCTREDVEWANVIHGFPDRSYLAGAKDLQWLHLMSAGVEGYADPSLYGNPKTVLTRSAGVHGPSMAEHAIGLALAVSRNFPLLYEHQKAHDWHFEVARVELFNSTVVMLGTGYLASDIIQRLKGFGCRIIGVRRDCTKPAPEGVDKVYPIEDLKKVLPQADYLFNTLPYTPATRNLLSTEEFKAAKSSMILINMGRGGTVDTPALVEALRSGEIGGAGLDVTEPEPLNPKNPLWDLPNVVISPHCSAVSKTTNSRRNEMFLRQLDRFLAGKPLEGVVDFSAGY